MLYFGYIRLEFSKGIAICEISTLEFVKIKFLTHTVNFCIQSPFSKVPGSVISEGLDPCSLYKVCHIFTLLFN